MEKLIITLAMLGNIPTKELNPDTPVTPTEVATAIEECAKLGISIAHIHARDEDQMPTHDREIFKATLDEIKRHKINIITQLSTGPRGGANTAEARGQMLDLDCDMASLTTGSSNFPNSVNANDPELILELIKKIYKNNLKPEIEIFDLGMLANAHRLIKKGILKPPIHFNLVMNVPGSIPGTPKNLLFLIESLPEKSTWTVSGIGSSQVQMITMAIALGGHVRTGLEDTMLYKKGVLTTNRALVERVVRIAQAVGREIATPEEAREILSLKKFISPKKLISNLHFHKKPKQTVIEEE
jgi:3-keto-5-aminohexanoate cleavage enzyme